MNPSPRPADTVQHLVGVHEAELRHEVQVLRARVDALHRELQATPWHRARYLARRTAHRLPQLRRLLGRLGLLGQLSR